MNNPDYKKLFELFFQPGEVAEIRALGLQGKGPWEGFAKGTVSGYYNDSVKCAETLKMLDEAKGGGVYFCLNPVLPALLARANNRPIVPKATTTDDQVTCHRWLFIDCDPLRPTGISATTNETKLAVNVRNQVAGWLEQNGFPLPISTFSGNGGHLLYRLPDLTNNQEITNLKRDSLKALALRFDSATVAIDQKVFNAARICKAYGTYGRKGDDTPDRPHRQSFLEQVPDPLIAVTLEQLKWLAAQAPRETVSNPPRSEKGSNNSTLGRLNVESYLSHYGIEVIRIKDDKAGLIYGLRHCIFNSEHSENDASIIQKSDGMLTYQCFHNSCQGRTWAEARQIISGSDNLARFCEGYKVAKEFGQQGSVSPNNSTKTKAHGRDLNELLLRFSSKTEYLWRQHIPKGMPTIVNGREGAGKSSICLAIAREILQANPNGMILWVASEGFVADTVVKGVALGLPMDGAFRIAEKPDGSYRFDLRFTEDRNLLGELLAEIKDRVLCVFIDSIRGMTGGDDNDPKTGSVMHRVNSIVCDRFGAALIYLDHHKKGKADSLLDRSVGTTAKTAAVRVVLSILPSSTYTRKIVLAKSNVCSTMPALKSIQMGDNIIISDDEEITELTLAGRAEQWLLSLFTNNSRLRAKQVFDDGDQQGYSGAVLKKAKAAVGIRSEKTDGVWFWSFPIETRFPCIPSNSCSVSSSNYEDFKGDFKGDSRDTESRVSREPREPRVSREPRDTVKSNENSSYISSVHNTLDKKCSEAPAQDEILAEPGDKPGCELFALTGTCRAAFEINLMCQEKKSVFLSAEDDEPAQEVLQWS